MIHGLFFLMFVLSGFCALVCQVVWLRLAMAEFGVTTALVSIVLSVFMAGLALGSWVAGRGVGRFAAAGSRAALRAYAACELLIALSAYVVPDALAWGRDHLLAGAAGAAWGSAAHHAVSGVWVTVVMLPFAFAMGATFPLALAAMGPLARQRSGFGHLYAANVLGATLGTLTSALVMIELLGFRGTLVVNGAINAIVAATALGLSLAIAEAPPSPPTASEPRPGTRPDGLLGLLFATGFVSMAMEVVWVRLFAPQLGNVVYAFAAILASYLVATFAGSIAYRALSGGLRDREPGAWWWAALAVAGVLPIVLADPRLPRGTLHPAGLLSGFGRVALALAPFCALLGGITPWLVDRWSGRHPARIGTAYAVNAVGCVLGPLAAGFLLLPRLDERFALGTLCLTLVVAGMAARRSLEVVPLVTATVLVAAVTVVGRGEELRYENVRVRRDSTATVMAIGTGMRQQVVVNGVGMTHLTPDTKMMVHLPLAWLARRPERGLVICLGMGTSFRSMVSWGVDTTGVELVPSVAGLFPEFHPDAAEILRSGARIVVDDGRRFLDRTREEYDVIAVDPPPPVEAAGSSLLYSREFYRLVRRRLAPDGILQTWTPTPDPLVQATLLRALALEFPHVRVFRSIEGWGLHLLASPAPLEDRRPEDLAARLPEAARRDLVEWGPLATPEAQFAAVLRNEMRVDERRLAAVPPVTDDRPINEYYAIRQWRRSHSATGRPGR